MAYPKELYLAAKMVYLLDSSQVALRVYLEAAQMAD